MVNAGIFGPKLSGKSTLAQSLSREFAKRGFKSIVLDPHNDPWGPQATVFTDEDKFWNVVWQSRRCVVFVEEAAATIRRERTLVPVFTRLRHCEHKLVVIGHSGMDLLPVMRQQLDTLYLFRQPKSACDVWAETMTEDGLLEAKNLGQYEFIRHVMYQKPRKCKLSL
jgi:molybdopterin-guanine dinucleotide biosynthesis protein